MNETQALLTAAECNDVGLVYQLQDLGAHDVISAQDIISNPPSNLPTASPIKPISFDYLVINGTVNGTNETFLNNVLVDYL